MTISHPGHNTTAPQMVSSVASRRTRARLWKTTHWRWSAHCSLAHTLCHPGYTVHPLSPGCTFWLCHGPWCVGLIWLVCMIT